ncbi:alpha/beta hydrolase family protein [Occallatibacter riparius]|uniref:Alpha/beta hydrolase family protein n=1 Tax=Occallatibacter riparius TaxID=1002689 RepID=A0A9J7BS06_9BACT|nr:alpha/beta hydrolase family protein [Occallatibacter riparius]UWZ85448.1 alpha/beta hydrolase family protein [Occallatibacter riparius]
MFRKSYARWMYKWETRLTTRDENRVVRPLEWGLEWIEPFLSAHHLGTAELRQAATGNDAAAEDAFARINQILIGKSAEFFGYEKPTDFRLEDRFPQLFPTNVRPETLAQDAELKQRAENGQIERAQFLRFTSPERTPYPENDLVNARWFPAPVHKDSGRPKQAIVVLPQWNADAFSHNALCHLFNRMGISALRLSKPYHDIRRPSELERSDYAVSANIGRTLSACRQAVVDIRCCIDWLEDQGYEHFGVLGTSLGSCYAFLASAHDKRIRVNAFNHASTAFGDVVWAGQSTRHIRAALEQAGLTQERLRNLWAAISPVHFYDKFAGEAAGGPQKKVLVVYADYDLTFPREYSVQVVDAFQRHGVNFETRVLPCGHYTTGETPYKYMDGWFLGSFVYRAYKQLREEKAFQSAQDAARDEEEVLSQ